MLSYSANEMKTSENSFYTTRRWQPVNNGLCCTELSNCCTRIKLQSYILYCISFWFSLALGNNNNQLPREAKKRPSFYSHSVVYVSNTFLREKKKGQRCRPWSESKIINYYYLLFIIIIIIRGS